MWVQRGCSRTVQVALVALLALGCGSSATPTPGAAGQSGGQLPVVPSSAAAGAGAAKPLAGMGGPPLGGQSAPVLAAGGGASAGTSAPGQSAAGAAAQALSAADGGGTLPCGVSTALAANCQSCHGTTPIGGAPMSLVTYADLHKAAVTQPSLKVYELAKMRINDKTRPMPPGGSIAAADFSTLDAYFGAGALAGTAADANCVAAPPPALGTGSADGTYGAIVPSPGETCYEFQTHQSDTSVDKTPYSVDPGEHYEQFYFKAPWPDNTVATRYGSKLDNAKVLHHWLLFSTAEDEVDGYHFTSPLPTLNGVDATLIAGWAVGGTNLAMPPDVGFELPPKGTQLNLQWHFYNSTGSEQTDFSAVQVCTVPAGMRPHTATISWIGNEDLDGNKWTGGPGMPAHQPSTFSGTCDPLREGMSPTEPIHIIGFWPHMHQLGVNMKAVVNHQDGTMETIFDKPFDFNHQVHYLQNYDLVPGDTLTAICDFNNTTNMGVPFGESSDTEMCYNFTFAWPAHALENHVLSLIGATNTCW